MQITFGGYEPGAALVLFEEFLAGLTISYEDSNGNSFDMATIAHVEQPNRDDEGTLILILATDYNTHKVRVNVNTDDVKIHIA